MLGTTVSAAWARGELEEVLDFEAESPPDLFLKLGAEQQLQVSSAKRWIGEAVLPLNICPYARLPYEKGQYLYIISDAKDGEEFISDFLEAADEMLLFPSSQVAAVVLFAPALAAALDFDEFSALSNLLEEGCGDDDKPLAGGKVGAAFFHPQHVFEGMEINDPNNYERRAPFACSTLLRADEVGAIVTGKLNEGRVVAREMRDANARRLRQEGTARLSALWATFEYTDRLGKELSNSESETASAPKA
mmetsp:Transcript_13594/g.34778  ORF Transcript_13594/g.34778 Transcript_13594/m.34778 type:complete len:248 (+) Transcript_13594:1388-2131(+)